ELRTPGLRQFVQLVEHLRAVLLAVEAVVLRLGRVLHLGAHVTTYLSPPAVEDLCQGIHVASLPEEPAECTVTCGPAPDGRSTVDIRCRPVTAAAPVSAPGLGRGPRSW